MNTNVLGVTYLKLNPKVAKVTKDYPENVNFAIKKSILSNFLDANSVNYSTREVKNLSPYLRANKLKNSTLYVSCIMTQARYTKLKKSRKKVLFEKPEMK